jgi:predicted nucleic acid-binding protein
VNASGRFFLDTNILIYADSADEPVKQDAAVKLLKMLYLQGNAVISTQVLSEFSNAALKKLKLPANIVRQRLAAYSRFETINVTPSIINSALDIYQTRSLSYYDALIVATAITAGCTTLYTEDMNNGERIDQIQLINPLKPSA